MHVVQLVVASVASGVYGARAAPSRMLATTGPPVRFQDCAHKYGPWPRTIPKGSTGWQDGQHANLTKLLISFTNTGIKGIKTEYVSFLTADGTTPSFVSFSHGTVTGRQKATVSKQMSGRSSPPIVIIESVDVWHDEHMLCRALLYSFDCTDTLLKEWKWTAS